MPGGNSLRPREESGLARDRLPVTIDTLPDDVLVVIFDFHEYIDNPKWSAPRNTWHALVHVCHRWRYLVFASPRRLNLRITYRGDRPVSEILDSWPVLPLSVINVIDQGRDSVRQWDNTVALLESEHYNRISEVYIKISYSRLERFAAAMQRPFPELTHLQVWTPDAVRVLPDSFLGGSAPRLRSLKLTRTPFPSIPKLLLSANRLVRLSLWSIPDSGYFSPDEMATALAVMTRLESLVLQFGSPRSHSDPASRPLPPPTRFVLPALTELLFGGVCEYLEDLLARIDAPLLYFLRIMFFMDLAFDVPQLHRLIYRVEEFKTFDCAEVLTSNCSIKLSLYPKTGVVNHGHGRLLELAIWCSGLGGQISSLAKVCGPPFPLASTLEELEIREDDYLRSSHWEDRVENAQWLELLDPFISLKNIYLTRKIAPRVFGALQELSRERATQVLPALRNLFIWGFSSLQPVQEAMMPFVVARRLFGHPVVVDHWKD